MLRSNSDLSAEMDHTIGSETVTTFVGDKVELGEILYVGKY